MHAWSKPGPLAAGQLYLTDSGFETTLIFHDRIELPQFAAFMLMRDKAGRERVVRYSERHIELARHSGVGFVLEGPTWRASTDWADRLGLSRSELAVLNRDAVRLMHEMRQRHATPRLPILISGTMGPRGDGYQAGAAMTAAEAEQYHAPQAEALVSAGVDMITAFTLTTSQEAIGIARAAARLSTPAVISFTLETDARLPSGETLRSAIEAVDEATPGSVAHYMINCAHPDHFAGVLQQGERWVERIRGLRANASRRSHQELDAAPDLDDGDPDELGRQYRDLRSKLPHLAVLGGCCGTDHRHVAAIAGACCGHAGDVAA